MEDYKEEEEHEFEAEIASLNSNPRFNELIEQALQSIERGETASHDDVLREFGLG